MNELLGWYGYDKVELRDSEANEMRNYRERRQHVSVLKGKGPLKRSSFHRFPCRCRTHLHQPTAEGSVTCPAVCVQDTRLLVVFIQ